MNAALPTVLVYKSSLLPYSETFIKEQLLALTRWRALLVGAQRVDGLPLDDIDVRLLRRRAPGRLQNLLSKTLRELDLPPPGAVRRLSAMKASLVHVHFGTEAVAGWPMLRRLDLPVVVTLHGSDIQIDRRWWESTAHGPAARRYPRRLVQLGREPRLQFVAVSEAVRERAIEYGLPPERVCVAYIGVDVDRFQPAGPPVASRAARILFVGRLVEKKGLGYLIDAYAALRQRWPQVELAVVGDGPLLAGFQAEAQRLRLPVEFLGRLGAEGVRRELQRARVLCLPSITAANGDTEGLGMVILEAQASGVPVVTSARGGATEALRDGVTGFAFRERDVAALTVALQRVLLDDSLAGAMSASAVSFVRERFDIRVCTAALERCYDGLAARR